MIDEAMAAIERENPSLKGVLPKDYSRPTLDKTSLGELVKLVGDIDLKADYILANPPFNMSDWGGERLRDDPRWKYGVPPQEADDEPFEEKMARLVAELCRQQGKARRLDQMIWRNLEALGYEH